MTFRRFAQAALVALVLWNFFAYASAQALPGERTEAQVRRVIDGDTFELDSGERVRLIGVDTPEYQPWKGRTDVYGREAADFARTLLKGKRVTLESDIEERDKYDRRLAYVYVDGEMVNRLLVGEGFAKVKRYPPNLRYQTSLRVAEKDARQAQKGLWSAKKKMTLVAK